ncbi:hypothetical protein Csa_022575 [Cucumis sativus]|nr:hypothetical protein Csa_022575 [Cucumis sativus]
MNNTTGDSWHRANGAESNRSKADRASKRGFERKWTDMEPVGFALETSSEIWNRGGLVCLSVRDE